MNYFLKNLGDKFMISSKPQGIDVFKSLIFLIMFFFGTVLQVNAQQIEITSPQYGATGIAIDANITIKVNYPFIFDTTSLPLKWTKDSFEDSRGKIWFVYEELYSGSDSSLLISSHVGGLGEVDSVNANLQQIIISNEKSFYYNSNYGLNISGMKLINTQTSQVITIDTVILGLFKTIHEPLRFMGTSFQDIPVTCRDNSFIVHFNDSLPTYQTAQGPIVTMDTVSMVSADSSNDSLIVTYHPINSTLQLVNGNKDLKVTLDNNFGDSLLYYLNIHLSRLTGNENDDISFSFKSISTSRITIHSGPADDLKPVYDTSYCLRVGRKLTLSVPEGNDDYTFERWICTEDPMFFFQSFSDSSSQTEIELTCENIRPELNFVPLYKKIQLDVDLPRPENNASIFPNPARDFIRISNSQNYQGGGYTITDLLGQEVQRGILEASNISVATLPSGMYFLVMRNGAKQIPMKFIKE